jgi:hypothetical protein
MSEVVAVLESFCSGFPRELFPLKNKAISDKKDQRKLPDIHQEQSYVTFL